MPVMNGSGQRAGSVKLGIEGVRGTQTQTQVAVADGGQALLARRKGSMAANVVSAWHDDNRWPHVKWS